MSRPSFATQSAVPLSICVAASAEGALPVSQPGLTAGYSWTGMQANTLGFPPVNGLHKMSTNSYGQTSGKLGEKVITGYTSTFH